MPRRQTRKPAISVKPIRSVAQLEDILTEPSPRLIESMSKLEGDIMLVGAGGKMGLTLAVLAMRAIAASMVERKVYVVSVFEGKRARKQLESEGVTVIEKDLFEPGAVASLPDAPNVVYMVGRKFGSSGAAHLTWATNVYLPGVVGERYQDSRIVAFSTGAVYPHVSVLRGGSTEATPLEPVGEYAMSCIGRERMFDYYAEERGTKVLHFRLNYSVEMRYGVLVDIAQNVWNGQPIDLKMGHLNCVWQGYANSVALQCFDFASSPSRALNVTGPELVSVRWAAERFGALMGKKPVLVNEESELSLLSNAAQCHRLFGYPDVSLDTLIEWIAYWIMTDGETLGKPTHYEVRDGKY